ncbi:asparaginase [Microbacterium karelineae]|uniref:asparaginase n=1 Tax=Microbacterium karelineae TaxID=2654283 RepID=UPI0012EA0492|nr:asparaginase [Microbacterium karelineae]
MTHAATFPASQAVELAVVERGGFVESRHIGSAIAIAPDGEIVQSHGDPSALILPRSSLKPLQAIACVTAGANLQGERLAIATASHDGTDRHAALVRDMLAEVGLGEDDLLCPPSWPGSSATRHELVRDGFDQARIRHNCSGKHAAMLTACRVNGWDTTTYLDPSHPLQLHIREVVERLTGTRIAATVTDGCGAPVHAMSLESLARGLHRAGASSEQSPFALHRSAAALLRAVRENPWVVEGPGGDDTVTVERFGVFSKKGAEGVQVIVAPDGTTVAVKMLDGSNRAGSLVALAILARAGAVSVQDVAEAAAERPGLRVLGGGEPVGHIRAVV